MKTQKPRKLAWLGALVISAWIVVCGGQAGATTVSFPDFSDLSPFALNGATAAIHSGGPIFFNGQNVLRLANGNAGGSGSAFLTNPITIGNTDSFTTVFQFQITDPVGIGDEDGIGGDGFMFVIQAQGANALGTGGGYLGYGHGQPAEPPPITPSLGIEFDTFNNDALNLDIFDADGNHVGVDINGSLISVASAHTSTRLNNGSIWNSWIDYDGILNVLEVRVSETPVRPSAAMLTYTVDLPSLLGSPNVFIGFTAGLAGATNDHDIRSWQFTSRSVSAVPEPSTGFLLASGIAGLAVWQRRNKG